VPASIIFHFDKFRAMRDYKTPVQLWSLAIKAFVTTRNRFISFYKNLGWLNFLRVSTAILLTSWMKVDEFEGNKWLRFVYMMGAFPLTCLAFAAFAGSLPRLKKRAGPLLDLGALPSN
jgi:hypothetical protein